MNKFETLERYWNSTACGHTIRVEEHRHDLSYIVEFYDDNDAVKEHCISHLPNTEKVLTVHALRGE